MSPSMKPTGEKEVPVETLFYTNLSFADDYGNKIKSDAQWLHAKAPDEKQKSKPSTLVSDSSNFERLLTLSGLFLAIIAGPLMPLAQEAYGELVNMMMDRQHPGNGSSTEVILLPLFGGGRILTNVSREESMKVLFDEDAVAHNYICFGGNLIQVILLAAAVALVKYSALHQTHRIRNLLFTSILRHDMSWYDRNASVNFTGKLNEELARLEDGIGMKLVLLVFFAVNILGCVAFNFYLSWYQTLIVGSVVPLTIIASGLSAKWQSAAAQEEMKSDSLAGTIFTEATSHIRTVLSFGGEEKEISRFDKQLEVTAHHAMRHGIATNFAAAFNWMINVLIFAVVFFNGLALDYDVEPLFRILGVFVNVWLIVMRFIHIPNLLDGLTSAISSSKAIFKTIHSNHGIDSLSNRGEKLTKLSSRIEFENVHFHYPSRPEVKVLNGVSFTIQPGQHVAVIGTSGSGKTTLLQLLQRFYDPLSGGLIVDGMNMQKLNVHWWRSNIGVVGQEASLFAGTIAENIKFGLLSASMDDVEVAAKKANAHGFISKLPMGYETVIGTKGQTLSGGEKQRIAIARALVRNPKILLLDEPTSALDSISREIVEAALNDAAKDRTTVMVTHRLSSVENADLIIVMDAGVIVEQGSHKELMAMKSFYYNMISAERELTTTGNGKMPAVGNGVAFSNHQESDEIESFDFEEEDVKTPNVSLGVILSWNRPELCYIIIGFLSAVLAGVLLPVCNILYGDTVSAFSLGDKEAIRDAIRVYSYGFLATAIFMFIVTFTELSMFTLARERLSRRLRVDAFRCILRQELGWFDDVRNHVGALYSRMSQDVLAIHAVNGPGVAMMVQAITMVIVGISLGIYFSWKLAITTTACLVPFFGFVLLDNFMNLHDGKSGSGHLEDASKIVVEVIQNKSVVTSLGLERYFIEKYNATMETAKSKWLKTSLFRATACAMGQSGFGFGMGVCFYYGCYLIQTEDLPYEDVIKISELIMFGALLLATEFIFTPTLPAAKHAANRMNKLFKRKARIIGGEVSMLPEVVDNEKIKFSQVTMSYPTRPDATILRSLNLTVKEGQNIAVVGPSGSGKSSLLYLLQRLYDPSSGQVSLNSSDVKSLTIPTLRQNLGLVSQEPVLFSGTIAENIAYGDNSREVSMAEVMDAAIAANIHDFIAALPSGYETKLGPITQLSGGQKQRIAIARALVRNPKVLLLDEATSALDPEGERAVQRALDKASQGRTTITIAHRIGAVANADAIILLVGGEVVEESSHLSSTT